MTLNLVRQHYESFPYPALPIFAQVPLIETYLMNYHAAVFAAFGSIHIASAAPRILVAGAGTFEPSVVALANPTATIVAVDISSTSLSRLKWRLKLHGIADRVTLVREEICAYQGKEGPFDMIVATGLLHHLPNREQGLKALERLLAPNGVLRLMIYSKHGRAPAYRIRDVARVLAITTAKGLERFIHRLPVDHPLRLYFDLYGRRKNRIEIMDGFLHVQDEPFDALDCPAYLHSAGMTATKFLHHPTGQPDFLLKKLKNVPALKRQAETLTDWQKIAVLDRLGELESNFMFYAARTSDLSAIQKGLSQGTGAAPLTWVVPNPVVKRVAQGGAFFLREMESRILGETVVLSKDLRKVLVDGATLQQAEQALGKAEVARLCHALILLTEESI